MQKQEEKAVDVVEDSGPLMIGLTIRDDTEFKRLEEIIDEERRVAIEGYVFGAETKELTQWSYFINLQNHRLYEFDYG